MEKLSKIALLFLILSLSFSSRFEVLTEQQRLSIPESESLRSVGGVYSVFPYHSCGSIPPSYRGSCSDFVADFCIDGSVALEASIQPLSSDESRDFAEVMRKLSTADREIDSLKSKLLYNIIKDRENCTAEFVPISSSLPLNRIDTLSNTFYSFSYNLFLLSPFSLPLYAKFIQVKVDCKNRIPIISDFTNMILNILIDFDAHIDRQRNAYENAAEALNIVFDKVVLEADSLYYEGGGYSNYSTQAYRFYNERIKPFIYKANIKQVSMNQKDISDKDFASAFIYLKETSRKVSVERTSLGNCEMGAMYSLHYAVAINYLIDLNRQIVENRAKLRADYEVLLSQAEQKLADAENKYNYLKQQDFDKITPEIILYAFNATQETALEKKYQIPSASLAEMKEYLFGSGSVPGAKLLIANAKEDTQNRVMFYYAKGMEKLSKSITMSDHVINNSYELQRVADELIIALTEKTRLKLDQANKSLSKYQVYDLNTATVYSQLNSTLENSFSLYYYYDPTVTTKGKRIEQLYLAAKGAEEVIHLSSVKANDVVELKKKRLKEVLNDLNSTIAKA
ncbi:MAG: hypothetical protein NZ903_00355, partial [Candidatus Micrarchaeota archaeon]|nr:hypothetical protein [Candidatus Micrarchaeota archaeon]